LEEAQKIINRIKKSCKKESNRIIPLSTSIGVASKKHVSQDINSVIKEADDQMYRNKLMNKRSPHSSLIFSLEKALEERNFETVEHVRRMREGIISLGRELDLSDDTINDLRLLSTLHDIGKIGISDNIILKPDKLNKQEWNVIKKHSEIGFRIAKSSNELSSIAEPILYHHEWWNGEGYPAKLKNEEIPISSRIVSIVDAYDAMTNDRPYRKALRKDNAIKELKDCAGIQFDPYLVDKFVSIC
jgi:HD-GYP domain-containing protein (c-di-GMP phosphodiesterase class II)